MPARKCVIDRSGNKTKVAVPSFRPKAGTWTGGDSHTLYAFIDPTRPSASGEPHVVVRPGGGTKASSMMKGIGPDAKVRVATKEEAEKLWQNPLHAGWKTACEEE